MDNATHDMSEKLMQNLDGELPAADKVQLEQQLASDAALREELENLQLAREAVRSYGLNDMTVADHSAIQVISPRRLIHREMDVSGSG